MKTKAILFDMDGVLVEAKEWHYQALNQALIAKGLTPISRHEHLSAYDGLPTKDKLIKHPGTRDLSPEEHAEINTLKQKFTCKVIEASCKPNSAIIELMEFLKSEGVNMACCSNSIRPSVEMMLGKSGILQYMDFVISNEDVENSKPAPEFKFNRVYISF